MIRRQHCLVLYIFFLIQLAASSPFRYTVYLKKPPFLSTPRGGSSLGKKAFAISKDDPTNETDTSKEPPEKKSYNLMLPKRWARFFYTISALNPFLAVLFNDYSRMLEPVPQIATRHVLAKTYETLFFFAKLKPRVSFAIGTIFRGLQLTTAFQYVFDPVAGVGFGLNLICLFAKSRWPPTIVLGWTLSKPMWKILGACPPSGLPVPTTVSWKTPKDAPVATKGYRIGL